VTSRVLSLTEPVGGSSDRITPDDARAAPLPFETVYDQHFDFVCRSLSRLGVRDAALEDALQDVFVVVHRRLPDFEQRSTLKTWIFGIAARVASEHRRREKRVPSGEAVDEGLPDPGPGPEDLASRATDARRLDRLLATLDDDKRGVFILAELEQMTAPEIAEALGIKLNTVYSRLHAARRAFDRAFQLEASNGDE
jgi:RNA polymerase sigma-70 factor, ECF subfamily